MKYPLKPAVRLPEFGTYELKVVGVYRNLSRLLRKIRETEDHETKEKYKEIFKAWWSIRHLPKKYLHSKKRPSVKARLQKLLKEHEQ
jgi:hypothetical protein